MKAGFGRMPITPQKPMTLAGFDRRTAPSQGALEDLFVSVLLLEDDIGGCAALCSFDLLGTDRTLCQKVRETLPLPAERVWVCASHTHSAPRGTSRKEATPSTVPSPKRAWAGERSRSATA